MADWEYINKDTDLTVGIEAMLHSNVTCNDPDITRGIVYKSKIPEHATMDRTNEVLTPYYKEIPKVDEFPKENYTHYDLFCLKTKLVRELHKHDQSWYPKFIPIEKDGLIYVAVRLYRGDKFVPLHGVEYNMVRDMVTSCISNNTDYCLLIHDDRPITYKGICIIQTWLTSILLTIPINNTFVYPEFPDTSVNTDIIYEDGAIYLHLDSNYSYHDVYNQAYIDILNNLYDLWTRGSIILDPKNDARFIRDWELVPDFYLSPMIDGDERKVYHPSWKNKWIAPSPSDFLIERRSGTRTVRIGLIDTETKKYYIAKNLSEVSYIFSGDDLLIEVDSYQEILEVHYLVMKALSETRGIAVVDWSYDGEDVVEYTDIMSGKVRSYLDIQ